MDFIIDKIKKIDFVKFFTVVVLFSAALFFIKLIMTDGSFFSELEKTYGYKQDVMYDYTVNLIWAGKGGATYLNKNEFYPPFANMLYHILFTINPIKETNIESGTALRDYFANYHVIIQIVVVYICIALFTSYVIRKFLKLNNVWDGLLLPFAIFTSYVYFLITILCGNNLILVTPILTLAIYYIFYDRSDKERIIGIILLAIAFGIKIYPAIFSLELLRKKQYLRFVEFGVLCICLVIFPMQLFGGFEGLILYAKNLLFFNTEIYIMPYCIVDKITHIFDFFGISINNKYSTQIIKTTFLLIMILFYFISEKRYLKVLFLIEICIHYMLFAHPYNLTLYLPVLLIFFKDYKDKTLFNIDKIDLLIFLLITLMYSYFFVYLISNFYSNFSYLIILIAMFDVIYSKLKKVNVKNEK